MLQGIKQQGFWPRSTHPLIVSPIWEDTWASDPTAARSTDKGQGWEWPGEEISHWTDLANHTLCSARFLGI